MAHRAPELPDLLREAYDELIRPAERPEKIEREVELDDYTVRVERVPRTGMNSDRIEFTVPYDRENVFRRLFGQTADQIPEGSSKAALGFHVDDSQTDQEEVTLYLGRDAIMVLVE